MGAPGFDDAPFVTIPTGQPHGVQFVMPYYENPIFLKRQIALWTSYPRRLREWFSIVLVDDGSPDFPARPVVKATEHPGLPIAVYRIEVDVRWNWPAARNVGMKHAMDGWCLLTDMDHMVEPHIAEHLVFGEFNPGVIYRFSRRSHDGSILHPHCNSMFMTKKMFWKVGGYDEAFSGFYGSDGDWRRRCVKTTKIETLHDALVRYEHVDDSSTVRYLRKQPEDAAKKRIASQRPPNWKPKVLSFPYHEELL
jgi:glycosyltransferase involved in cell wall biosynthesis